MFSSVILISLVSNPLIRLLQIIPNMGAGLGCFQRLEEFLQKPERVDDRAVQMRQCLSDADKGPPSNNSRSEEAVSPDTPQNGPIVSIRNADLGWGEGVLLKRINMDVAKGEHIAITGVVGSGKSLLLNSILGEVRPKAGSVHVRGIGVAYCSQTTWLENLTAHENVFRRAAEDEAWYERVIDACALRDFLHSQQSGETIGTSGAKISGGERQRLVRTD